MSFIANFTLFRMLGRASAALLIGLIAGCASMDTRVEQTLRSELPRLIGPADRYTVRVEGAHSGSDEVSRVYMVAERVRRPKAPVLDLLEIELRDVVVDREQKKLRSVSSADTLVRVLTTDVAAFLEKRRELDLLSLTFAEPDVISLTVRPVLFGFVLPRVASVNVEGRLVPRGGELQLRVDSLRIAGVATGRVPAYVVQQMINPIVDFSALPVPSEIQSVRVQGNALIVRALGSLGGQWHYLEPAPKKSRAI